MASRTRPFLMTGAALASAAAIVTASPAILPTHDLAVGAPTPLPLSTAQYELTAITDITLQGINDAYWFGWGGYVGCGVKNAQGECTYTPPDPYYPGVKNIFLSGASGVLYYLVDTAAESFIPGFDLDNYYFEIGAPAVPYVGAGELFGTDSPIFQAAQATFYYGIPNVINSIVVSATELVPEVDLGPVKVGGGILASLYFYGATPDGTFDYGTPGLSAILAYISTSISDSLPSAAALSGAATAAAAAIEGVVKNVENAINPTASASAAAKTVSAASTEKNTATAEDKTESTDASSTEGSSTEGSSTEGSSTEGSSTEGSSTEGSSTEGSSTEGSSTEGSSTEGSSTEGSAKSTATAPSAKPATTTKATKPAKPENPLAKLGKRISDALGGGKKAKSESSSSSDSSSSSSSSSDSSSSGDSAK